MATTSIGLDIGSSAVRAVQLTTGGRGPATIDRIGQVLLPPGAVSEGELVEPAVVAEAVRTLWSRYGFKGKQVAMGVANQQVVVRQLDLPYLPEPDFRQSLQFQVDDAIPIPVEQAILDYHVLGHFETEEGQRINRVMLVAAHKEMVDRLVEVASLAKLEPVLLDLDAFALLRSLSDGGDVIDERGGEMLVDAGAGLTNIVIHERGVPRFVRILVAGGNEITEALQSALGLEHDAAEDLKARTGVVESTGMFADDDAARLVEERAMRFVDEIRGSLDFYAAQADAVPVTRVVLTGGASQLKGLAGRVAQQLRIPVDRGHPMQELRIGKVGLDTEQLVDAEPYLAVAIGLALGAAQ